MNEQNKILIIIGSAPCVQDDILNFRAMPLKSRIEYDWMLIGLDAVNKISWPAKYFATYHPYEILESKERRAKAGGNTDWTVISHQQHESLVDIIIPLVGVPSGSSALLGVHAGIQEGYNKIIVCGCPLTGKNDNGDNYEVFQKGWEAKLGEIKDKVRSMSGWTKEILGAPTEEWLNLSPAGGGVANATEVEK